MADPTPVTEQRTDPRRNVLLRSMPVDEFARIEPAMELVTLPRPTELDAPDTEIEYVYFPISGLASIVALGSNGESVDTTMIGREGMTGLAVFLGTNQMPVRTMVQMMDRAVFSFRSAGGPGACRGGASRSGPAGSEAVPERLEVRRAGALDRIGRLVLVESICRIGLVGAVGCVTAGHTSVIANMVATGFGKWTENARNFCNP